jgi:formylglycine-generating enzyme required for sulfatase activity
MTGNDGMTLLYVPAGEFTMGSEISSDEQPVHQVYLDSYWIDKTEVTNSMYLLCVEAGACSEHVNKTSFNRSSYYGNARYDNYPVIFVDWDKAKIYCEWADRRLPSEAEWEKAARGLDGRTYPWGEKIDCSLANYWGNGIYNCAGDTDEVGNYPNGASIYGALDMAGNVSEWVGDYYSDSYYQNAPASNPLGPDSGQFRLLRGGSWLFGGGDVRSADRFMNDPSRSNTYFGFRCAKDAE